MKILKNLNKLNKKQITNLESQRNSCIVLDKKDIPSFEFATYTSEDINYLSVTDNKKETILPWCEAVKLKNYLNETTPTFVDDSEHVYEYVKTVDMNLDEQEKWEEEGGCVISGSNEGVLELSKSYFYDVDENWDEIPGTRKPCIHIAMLEDDSNSEAFVNILDKNKIRKLRDYLNNYLEDNL